MISIVIPTYEMQGRGIAFLRRALDSLNKQVVTNASAIEIVLSDHSTSNDIEAFIKNYPSPFSIHYFRNPTGHGNISQNLNFGIAQAHFDYVKPLFQDDLLVETHYLADLHSLILKHQPEAVFSAVTHTENGLDFFDDMIPRPNEFLLFGQNTLSSPSILTIKKALLNTISFDENLKLLLDCDFYYAFFKMQLNYVMLESARVANGVWQGQAHGQMNGHDVVREVKYLLKKYPHDNLSMRLKDYVLFLKSSDRNLAKALAELI
jgi:glycosyltransferase involved in cell wall biosynthesis